MVSKLAILGQQRRVLHSYGCVPTCLFLHLFTSFFCIPLYPELRHGLSFHILIASASAFCQLMRNRQLTWKLKLAGVTTTTATSQFRLRLQEDTGPKIEPLRVRDVVCEQCKLCVMYHHVPSCFNCLVLH